jgi:hypothetical protein
VLYIGRMFELKPISPDSIPEALAKAERYRLLNEPWQAESICLDVLRIAPGHQRALTMLLLSLTEQFGRGVSSATRAREILPGLSSEYERTYYAGIVFERWAQSLLRQGSPGWRFAVYHSMREAMEYYERAEALRPPGNDEALLRWNTCARILMRNPELRPRADAAAECETFPVESEPAPPEALEAFENGCTLIDATGLGFLRRFVVTHDLSAKADVYANHSQDNVTGKSSETVTVRRSKRP